MSLAQREILRFFRSSPLAIASGTIILAVGFAISALALTVLNVFSSLSYSGVVDLPHATIAEAAKNGASFPISYRRFEHISYAQTQLAVYSVPMVTESLTVAAVSRGFFGTFTAPLQAGRDFSFEENERNAGHAVILSAHTAESLFGSANNALDRSIKLKGTPYTVVGVAPGGFSGLFGDKANAWTPAASVVPLRLPLPPDQLQSNPDMWKDLTGFYALVQRPRGTTSALTNQIATALPPVDVYETQLHVSPGLTTDPLRDANLRQKMRLGLALAAIFTLISSLNFALLLLARMIRLADESQLKRSLGASYVHLLQDLSVGPAALICLALALAGLLLAGGMTVIQSLPGFIGQVGQGADAVALRAFAYQIPFAAMLTIMIVVAPVVRLWRDQFSFAQRTSTADQKTLWLLQTPVALQIALTASTGVLTWMVVSSLIGLSQQNLGYEPSRLTLFDISPLPGEPIEVVMSGDAFSPQFLALASLLNEAAQKPGIRGIGYAAPLAVPGQSGSLAAARPADQPNSKDITVNEVMLSPGCLSVLGARLLRGRDFPDRGGANEMILNQTAAQSLFPNEDPINKSVTLDFPARFGLAPHSITKTVVGVIADMREPGYGKSVLPAVYQSTFSPGSADISPQLVVDTTLSPEALRAVLVPLATPRFGNGKEIVSKVTRMRDFVDDVKQAEIPRTYAAIAGALLMGAVSMIGLYAALKFYVGSRRRELAIRVCLGAGAMAIRGLLLRRALWCAAAGIVLASPVILVLRTVAGSETFGHLVWSTPGSALTCLLCILFALAVAWIPSRRAMPLAPAQVLKEE